MDSNHRVLGMAFIDRGGFEAMKSLSGWEAARSDEHQFRAKIKVSTLAVLELSSFDKWSEQRKKERRKMALSLPHTFAFSCLPHGFWATI